MNTPTERITLAALGLAIAGLSAQATDAGAQWVPGGIPIAPGVGSGQSYPIPAGDGLGGLYVAWRDRRSGQGDVYLQNLTAEGYVSPGWLPSGLLLATGSTDQTPLWAAQDEAGGVIVVWIDGVSGGYDIRAQRIHREGTIAKSWPSMGIVVAGASGYQTPEAMMSDGGGGAFIAWSDDMGGATVLTNAFLQHIGPDGRPVSGWPASGKPILPTPGHHGATRLISDGAGGVIAITAELGRALPDTPTGRGTNHSAVRFLPTGELAPGWPAEGVLLLRTLSAVEVREICSDGAGGAYFAWNDNRFSPQPANPFYYDVYAQHVLADGRIDPRWPADGLPVAAGPAGQYDFDIAADGQGGAFIAWQEFRSDADWQIYALRLRPDGSVAPGWMPDGNRVTTNEEYEVFPTILPDEMGGFWVIWQVHPGGITSQRYGRMGGDGQVAPGWSSSGVSLSSSAFHPLPVSDEASGMYIVFERGDDGPGVWAQRVYGDVATLSLPSLVHAEATAGQASLRWSLGDAAPGGVRVERRNEKEDWVVIGVPATIAPRLLEYVDRNLAAGRYAYRLSYFEAGVERHSAETWLELQSGASLALAGFRPNPAIGVPTLIFTLPDDQPARLDVFDVKGRAVISREIGGLGSGAHVMPLADEPWSAGMYWIRLSHPDRTLTTKGLVAR